MKIVLKKKKKKGFYFAAVTRFAIFNIFMSMSTQPNEEIPKIGLAQFNHVKQAKKLKSFSSSCKFETHDSWWIGYAFRSSDQHLITKNPPIP